MFGFFADVIAALYAVWPSYGADIVILTVLVVAPLTPLTLRQTRSMLVMQRLQPELKRLREQHNGNREALNAATVSLYQEHRVNPVSGCLPVLVQMPLFIVLYRLIRGLTYRDESGQLAPHYLDRGSALYRSLRGSGGQMVSRGMDLSRSALSPHDSYLAAVPFVLLAAAVVATSWWQQQLVAGRSPQRSDQQRMIGRVMPAFMGVICLSAPAGVGVYYATSNLLRVGQQQLVQRRLVAGPVLEGRSVAATTEVTEPAMSEGHRSTNRNTATKKRSRQRRRSHTG